MGNIFHPCIISCIGIVVVILGAQKASKQSTRFPCCSACHLMVRCGGYWHSGAGKVELRSLLNQTLLREGTCLKANCCSRAYRTTLFRFLLLWVQNQAEGSCGRGIFLPLHYMVPFNSCISFTGQDKCFPCPAGFHCSKGLRHHCPPGFYCPQKTGISFYPCPPGTYNPSYGLSHSERCQQCPAGDEMTEYSDCPCRAVSKRVISLHISFANPLMHVWPLGNANIKINSHSKFLVPRRATGFFEALQKSLVYTKGFPEEHDLSLNAVLSQLCWCWEIGSLKVFLFAFQSVHVAQQLSCFFLPVYWYSFSSVVFQECSVENGDYPLQVVPAGQDSSAQQVLNLAFTGRKEKWKNRKLWPFRNYFLYILCAVSPWLLLQRVPG